MSQHPRAVHEQGTAPSNLTLLEQEVAAPAFALKRSLPLCEWPTWPKHKGGDAALAESFDCVRE